MNTPDIATATATLWNLRMLLTSSGNGLRWVTNPIQEAFAEQPVRDQQERIKTLRRNARNVDGSTCRRVDRWHTWACAR